MAKKLSEDYNRVLILGSYGRFKLDREARSKLINELKSWE
jgi:hypothetical protein